MCGFQVEKGTEYGLKDVEPSNTFYTCSSYPISQLLSRHSLSDLSLRTRTVVGPKPHAYGVALEEDSLEKTRR